MYVFILLLALLLPLTGCYEPVYGNKGFGAEQTEQEAKLNNVAIANIPDENGQKLRNLLIDRFYGNGRPINSEQRLDVRLIANEVKLGLQKDATTRRARLEVTAAYDLVDVKSAQKLFSASSRTTVNYNILDQQYGTLASKENAYARALEDIANLITARLLLFYNP